LTDIANDITIVRMIVVDVNVILSGLRSSRGASHVVLRALLEGRLAFAVSPAVALEYEAVLKRRGILGPYSPLQPADIDIILDGLFFQARLVSPRIRYRPFLDDPKDDLYVECALNGGASRIISNDRHFQHPAMAAFGLEACSAGAIAAELLRRQDQ
jgi:predicted nucleic acid-binding protein